MVQRLVLALVATALLAAPARAATVSVGAADPRQGQSSLSYAAAAGEVNHVTIAGRAGGKVRVTDATAPLTAGAHCTAGGAHVATCAPGPAGAIDVVGAGLRDRADTLTITRGPGPAWNLVSADGGPGNDRIDLSGARTALGNELFFSVFADGGPGNDTITGSPGRDAFGGGAGRDVLHGGAERDSLDGDGHEQVDGDTAFEHPARDVLDGGPGRDVASYAAHPVGVRVDLLHPRHAGAPGENDRLRSIEDVTGSISHDVLRGDGGANELQGWTFQSFADHPRSPDRLVGRGGNDILGGTPLPDVFDGGPGRDVIDLQGGADHTHCGSGRDTIQPDLTPLLQPAGCERLDDGSYTFGPFHVRAGHLRATLTQDDLGGLCHEELHLRSLSGAANYGNVAWNGPKPPRLSVPLTAAGRAAHTQHKVALVRELGCTGSPHRWLVRL